MRLWSCRALLGLLGGLGDSLFEFLGFSSAFFLEAVFGGHVAHDLHQAAHLAVIERRHDAAAPEAAAVFADVPAFVFRSAFCLCFFQFLVRIALFAVFFGEDDAGVLSQDF